MAFLFLRLNVKLLAVMEVDNDATTGNLTQESIDSSPSKQSGISDDVNAPHGAGVKRKRRLYNKHVKGKLRKVPLSMKPPLMVLHEKVGKVEFEIVSNGEGVNAGFTASFTHDGTLYKGVANSKSKAKSEAAQSCLTALGIEFKTNWDGGSQGDNSWGNGTQWFPSQPSPAPMFYDVTPSISETSLNFTEDDANPWEGSFEASQEAPPQTQAKRKNDFPMNNPNFPPLVRRFPGGPFGSSHPLQANLERMHNMKIPFSPQKAAEFPSMVLHELFPNIADQLEWIDTGLPLKFSCKVVLSGREFQGTGVGKRAAKQELAKDVLSAFFGIRYFKTKRTPIGKAGKVSTIGRMHPYAKVKHVDPQATYSFTETKDADGVSSWKATLKMKGKEYTSSTCSEKEQAKFSVAKMGYQDNQSSIAEDESTPIQKVINPAKNPLQMFYEYYGHLEFIEEDVSDRTGTRFFVGIDIDGKVFTAQAASKKKAKKKLVLKVFEEVNEIPLDSWTSITDEFKAEFKAENEFEDPSRFSEGAPGFRGFEEVTESPKKVPDIQDIGKKNPVSILYELHQGLEFLFSEQKLSGNQTQFSCFVTIGDKTFDGVGQSKKTAKIAAATKALEILYNITNFNMEVETNTGNQNQTDIDTEFADKIVQAVTRKFNQVFQSEVPYKVLAGIAMAKEVNGKMMDAFEVLSIGTGTKCIGGESINNSGQVLNDCHAEIIACRGLRQFFFDQLQLAMTGKESCLERKPKAPLFQLKSSLHLYLYINTAPCGDGRVYNNAPVASNNKTIGMLRTKIENGQGTVPVPASNTQTTDGILAGERLLTMSCSDKLMKWNVLGLQGSLLTHFMKPVYLKGIIIGEQYNYEHLSRSLVSRITGITNVPQPYSIVKPEFGKPTKTDGRDTSKATNSSYNWYYGQTTVEIINGVSGRTPVAMPSRLSKMVFYDKFCQVVKVSQMRQPGVTYHDAKVAAKAYQKCKSVLFNHLEAQGYGKWVGKPVEQDTFG